MPSAKKGLRLLLEPAVEHHINRFALKEGRPLATMCSRLLSEAVSARLSSERQVAQVSELVTALRRPSA